MEKRLSRPQLAHLLRYDDFPPLLRVASRVVIPDVSAIRGTWKIHGVLRARLPDGGNPPQEARSGYVRPCRARDCSFIQEQPHRVLNDVRSSILDVNIRR